MPYSPDQPKSFSIPEIWATQRTRARELMDIQVVTDDVPAFHLGIRCHEGLHMSQKIVLGARRSAKWRHKLSGDDVMTEHKASRSMALVFECASALHDQ